MLMSVSAQPDRESEPCELPREHERGEREAHLGVLTLLDVVPRLGATLLVDRDVGLCRRREAVSARCCASSPSRGRALPSTAAGSRWGWGRTRAKRGGRERTTHRLAQVVRAHGERSDDPTADGDAASEGGEASAWGTRRRVCGDERTREAGGPVHGAGDGRGWP